MQPSFETTISTDHLNVFSARERAIGTQTERTTAKRIFFLPLEKGGFVQVAS
jgi:hypothetical protein